MRPLSCPIWKKAVPVEAEPQEPIVDVLVEQDGEWILQSAVHTPDEPSEEDVSEEVDIDSTFSLPKIRMSGRVRGLFWRFRFAILGVGLMMLALVLLFLGGAINGRMTHIQLTTAPMWGGMKVELDDVSMRGRSESKKLSLGEHSIDILGGMFEPGGCGRCCWTDKTAFSVPFGWGDLHEEIDLGKRTALLQCPTVEQSYLFEKIRPMQDWMGAPFDIPMRGDNALWHQVTLSSGFWIEKLR